MKKYFFILALLIICENAFGQLKEPIEKKACYYVYLDRQSPDVNEVKGQNEKGDVIDVLPCSKIDPPEHDFYNFDILKMSLTPTEAEELKQPLLSADASEENGWEVEKERKHKIDVSTLQKATPSKLGDTLYEKSEITEKLTVKSVSLSINK